MKSGGLKYGGLLAAVILFIVVARVLAQSLPEGHANGFTTDAYYEPPNEQHVRSRLSGTDATPLPGGLLDIKNLRIETFTTNGASELVARAPQCTYAAFDGWANSTGHLELVSGDGRFFTEGDGFYFVNRANAMSLSISNHVHTVIKAGLLRR
jgi:hypothetical protein